MTYNVKRHAVVQPLDQSIKLIPLTKGFNTVVDASEYEKHSRWNWAVTKNGDKLYATRSIRVDGKHKHVYLHREILPDAEEVDHWDGDGLNNRRSNLRESTHAQNNMNKPKQANNKTGYKGVAPNHNNFMAHIQINGKLTYLGTRKTPEEAARLYDDAAIRFFGEFAYLNFPREIEEQQ